MIEVIDAIDRQVVLARPAQRIVSLVPSETLSVAELVGVERIVGRTDFCLAPEGQIQGVASVGGTKGFDVEAVKRLHPDLILANKEENSRPLVEAMIADGLPVHVSFPCTVEQSNAYLVSLCTLLGVDPESAAPLLACRRAVEDAMRTRRAHLLPVFVPIWRNPWMTFDAGAYASDVLELCGAVNVFAERARRYPLAADLGKRDAWSADRVEGRDTRYPRIRLEEVVERGARAALLPDEPYRFTEEHLALVEELDAEEPMVAKLVDGKDLFWYGTQVARAVPRLSAQVSEAASVTLGTAAHK